jgi:hypothetical protein
MSYETGDLVAHFFCSDSDMTRLTANQLFRSYIKQIIGYLSIIKKPVPEKVVTAIRKLFGPKALPAGCAEVIDEIFYPLSDMLPSAIFFVDGLEQCAVKEIRIVRRVLRNLSRDGVKVFISGRESLDVTNSIPGSITIEISNEDVREDIHTYIEDRIKEKMLERQLTENKEVLEDIKTKLNDGADRM